VTEPWLAIIGIGDDGLAGLSGAARALIENAELIVGGERHLALVPVGKEIRHCWDSPLAKSVARIAARQHHRAGKLVLSQQRRLVHRATKTRAYTRDGPNIVG